MSRNKLAFTHYEAAIGKGEKKVPVVLKAKEGDISAAREEARRLGARERLKPRYVR